MGLLNSYFLASHRQALGNPVKDTQKLVADLRKAIDAATTFCAARQVILPAIEQLNAGSMERLQRIDDAVNALISPDPLRREFLGHIGKLLDALITGVAMPVKPAPVMDLSKIDFAALRSRFKESKHKNTDLEVLKAASRLRTHGCPASGSAARGTSAAACLPVCVVPPHWGCGCAFAVHA